ncbi:hypothetical protein [Halorientalis halophila]|uniref:hypothetical protein n=1 Tax=Halorientalis halophila TaxID=3108499 RepID=UPI003008D7AE
MPASTSESTEADEPGAPDVETAISRIEDRAATVRDRQVRSALATLDARGDLDQETRAAVERVADRLTERLLATPKEGLRAAASDRDAAAVAIELFGD